MRLHVFGAIVLAATTWHVPAIGQATNGNDMVIQVGEKEARKAAEREALTEQLRAENEATKAEHERQTASARPLSLSEFIRDNPDLAEKVRQDPKPRMLWPYSATAAAAVLL